MAAVVFPGEVVISYNGSQYIVNLTVNPSDFYIRSVSTGARITVPLDTAAKLFGAEKAIGLLNSWFKTHDANYYTSEWQQIANSLLINKGLQAARDLLGQAAGIALGSYLAGFNKETALSAFKNFAAKETVEVTYAGLAYVVIKDAIGQFGQAYSEYQSIAASINAGTAIDFSRIKLVTDEASIARLTGYAAVEAASKLSDLNKGWLQDVKDLLHSAISTIVPSVQDFGIQQYLGTGNIDYIKTANILGWINTISGKLGDLATLRTNSTAFSAYLETLGIQFDTTITHYQPLTTSGILDLEAALKNSSSVTSSIVVAPNTASSVPSPVAPPPNTAPTVVGSSNAFAAGTVLSVVNYFPGIDKDSGDTVQSYKINDATGSGFFRLGGVNKPEGTEFTVTAAEYAQLQYVVGAAGTSDIFTISASDGHNYGAKSTFTVTGLNPATAPAPNVYAASDDTATTTSGHPIVINALANDDSHLVRITSLSGADSQFITIKPGTQDAIIVAPSSSFVGTYRFSYTATDGHGASATAQVTVNVGAYNPTPTAPVDTNHKPVAPDVHQTINVGQQDNINPLIFSYDIDPSDQGGVLTLVNHGNAEHGTISQNGNVLTYTPSNGFVGDDHFSYTIQDTHSAQATGTITVTVNKPPVAQDDFVVTNPNTPITFNVLQNDQNNGSGALTLLSTSSGPSHGSLTFSANGNVTYTPTSGYSGIDTFNYLAYDGNGGFSQATATVAVGASSVLTGTGGNDILVGTSGGELIQGLGGDDKLSGGPGDDTVDGGTGFNTADFSNSPGPVNINLTPPAVAGDGTVRWDQVLSDDGFGTRDSLRNIDGAIGSAQGDNIQGNSHDNIFYGNGGDDHIYPNLGHDTVYGGDGNDEITAQGAAGFYNFFGGNGDDQLAGGPNTDLLDGGDGDDFIVGGGGADTLLGGNGKDTLRASGTLDGGAGNDTITGGAGNDTLLGGDGDDSLADGGGTTGDDIISGGNGNDTIYASNGNDTFDGGAGVDEVDFDTASSPIVIDLAAGFALTSTGFDILKSIESIRARALSGTVSGSDAADRIYGDLLFGGLLAGRGGDDVIIGGNHSAGEITIQGDEGADVLTGGIGHTRFAYHSILDGADTITDFITGTGGDSDILDFGDVLASVGYSGATPIHDGYLRLVASGNNTVLQIDLDGTGNGAQFKTLATLQNVTPSTLVAGNFASTVDVGAISGAGIGNGPVVSDWSQALSYQRSQTSVALGSMVVADPDPAAQLTIQLVLADPTVGSLASSGGGAYDGTSGAWSVQGTIAQVNAALATLAFVPSSVHPGNTTISTFASDGVNAPVAGLITLDFINTPTVLNGTAGDDLLLAQAGDNLIFGGLGNNDVNYRFSGAIGITIDLSNGTATNADGRHDSLFDIQSASGTDFSDTLKGDAGDNRLLGLDGDDTIIGGAGAGNDVYDGGDGIDTVVYSSATLGIIVDLSAPNNQATGPEIGTDQISNIENVVGGSGNDLIKGNGNNNIIDGGAGNDTLDGAGGSDTVDYSSATQTVIVDLPGHIALGAQTGTDALSNIENVKTGSGNDAVAGDGFTNVLDGGAGSDTVSYYLVSSGVVLDLAGKVGVDGTSTDTLLNFENANGTAYNDAISGTAAANVLDGLGGIDTISYYLATQGVVIDLAGKVAVEGGIVDTILNFENVNGSAFNDAISGDAGANVLDGLGGIDTLSYYTTPHGLVIDLAFTVVVDGAVTDIVRNFENVNATQFDDAVAGNAAANVLDGLGGIDTISYYAAAQGVTVNLGAGTGVTGGVTDTLLNFENVNGSAFADIIVGNTGANVLNGLGGADTLTGGSGFDTFVFNAGQANGDAITDFAGNGASAGDAIRFVGFGTAAQGATFTQVNATQWQIHSGLDGHNETITLSNSASVHSSDLLFV